MILVILCPGITVIHNIIECVVFAMTSLSYFPGLHGYSCTLELRNQRKSFWSEQFRSIYCKRSAIAGNITFNNKLFSIIF